MLPSPLTAERYWLPVRRGGSPRAVAVASALAHFAALALVFRLAAPSLPAPPSIAAVTMIFTTPAAAPAPVSVPTRASALPAVVPVRPEEHITGVTGVAIRRARRTVPQSARTQPRVPTGAEAAAPQAAAPMVARPAAAAVADIGLLIGHFTNDIQAVVRAAAVMPAAARRQHREGRAQVRFDYLDGNVHGVALAQSSASRLLDDAALSAVQTARYPAPPPQLRGRKLSLVVWIDFHLGGASPG